MTVRDISWTPFCHCGDEEVMPFLCLLSQTRLLQQIPGFPNRYYVIHGLCVVDCVLRLSHSPDGLHDVHHPWQVLCIGFPKGASGNVIGFVHLEH